MLLIKIEGETERPSKSLTNPKKLKFKNSNQVLIEILFKKLLID